jgi:hypothetical protein
MPCRRHEVTLDVFGQFCGVLYEDLQVLVLGFYGAVSICWPFILLTLIPQLCLSCSYHTRYRLSILFQPTSITS